MDQRPSRPAFASLALLLGAMACGSNDEASTASTAPATGGLAGKAGAAGSQSNGSAGAGPAGLGGMALGTAGATSATGVIDCGPDKLKIAYLPELQSPDLHMFATNIAVDETTVYVGFHDGNKLNVDRYYAFPRCGGPPTLLVQDVTVAPPSLSAGPAGVFVVHGTAGGSKADGVLRKLTPVSAPIVATGLSSPRGVFVQGEEVFVNQASGVRRWTAALGLQDQLAPAPDVGAGAIAVDETWVFLVTGGKLSRVSRADGAVTPLLDARTHILRQHGDRLFMTDLDAKASFAIDKLTGGATQVATGAGYSISLASDQLFLSGSDMVTSYDLAELKPVANFGYGEVVAADAHHVFTSSGNEVVRHHR